MATVHKVTWVFSGRKHGWSESLYFNSTDENHDTTMIEAKSLAGFRAALLGTECSIDAIRISTEGVGPDAMLRYFDDYTGDPQKAAAEPDVGVLVRCENLTRSKWKHIFLRGVWDVVEEEHGKYKRNAFGWKKKMTDYLQALTGNQWCWNGSTRAFKSVIANVSQLPDDRMKVEFGPGMFVLEDSGKIVRLRVSGVNGKSAANGLHVFMVNDASSVITQFPRAVGVYRRGGTITKYTYAPVAIKFAADEKITTRRAGAPLLESRGRRKAQPRA